MARRKHEIRVLGPYKEVHRGRTRWKVVIRNPKSKDRYCYFETEREAVDGVEAGRVDCCGELTIGDVIDKYEIKKRADGLRNISIIGDIGRLRRLLPVDKTLNYATPSRVEEIYKKRCEKVSADSHREELKTVKRFFNWCVESNMIVDNPASKIKPIGRRNNGGKGMSKLRIDEGKKFLSTAVSMASKGDVGAIAAITALLCGLRASDIINATVRDIDDNGRLLVIPSAKTKSGTISRAIPETLRSFILTLCEGRKSEEKLFGEHRREWPRCCVRRVCKKAGIPMASAHSLKGLHNDVARSAGVTGEVVAKTLGHSSVRVGEEHYLTAGIVEDATAKLLESRLAGESGETNEVFTVSPEVIFEDFSGVDLATYRNV